MKDNQMNHRGRYIYGVIETSEEKSFGPIGFGDQEVYTVPCRDISAVVSDSPIIVYNSMTKDKVVRDLFCHQSVIEKVMKDYTITPIKFGTFAEEEEEVARILKTGYQRFKEALGLMDNKIELDVVALWNKEIIFKEIGEEKEIKEFKKKIASGPNEPQLNDRIKLGKIVERSLKRKNRKYEEWILCALKEIAFDFCSHDTLDDAMILNASFLLDKDREGDFDRKLNELDEKYKKRVNFRCVGPLPPYSFSTIELKKLRFEEIDWARRLLGLREEMTRSEIKSAHRKLAFKYHPDKNPPSSRLDEEFNELTRAYKLLLEYCQSDRCSLRKEGVKDLVLIKVLKIGKISERKKY